MNKIVLATAVLATAAFGATINCPVATQTSAETTACTDIADAFTPTVTFTPTPTSTKEFATITYTSDTATTCAQVAELDAVKACAAELTISNPSDEVALCIATDAKQGASTACALDEGETCSATLVCDTGLTCQDDKCATAPTQQTITCAVTTQTTATTTECTDIAAAFTPALTMTPSTQKFATITYSSDTAKTCTAVAELDAVKACAAKLTIAAPSAAQTACIATDAKQGTNAACAVAEAGSCKATTEPAFTPVCDTALECKADKCTAIPYFAFTEVKDTEAENFKSKEDFTETVNDKLANEDDCKTDPVITVTISKYYENQKLAIGTFSATPSPACVTKMAAAGITAAAASDVQKVCATTCGSATCLCEQGMECTPTDAESEESSQGNCVEGELCIKGDDNYTCNSSLIASAAFAVGAAILAVMF